MRRIPKRKTKIEFIYKTKESQVFTCGLIRKIKQKILVLK